jgi:alpha-mannosidase
VSQPSQTFVVTYTDGTTTTLTQSLSDWFTLDNFPGESIARTESYRLNPDGSIDNETFYVYGYSFAIDATKTVKSLTLPNNVSVVVLAVSLQSAPAAAA